MENALTGKVSQKGQVVIPASIRKALDLKRGSEVSFKLENGAITIKKLPTALDWANLVKQIPVENVDIDENGHYDPKKSPDFHDWMVNG
ncbi:AbrB/MazE/SpoVT family DNA-binding domain-containing protein [Lactobacillus sp. ESL0260]|uniref:AbrB/MazE/SpoVT family DNA-binding domain-containing protein n=1 Tax=Lactobacillus sp. ESL0260 TaxID=2069347 RepID=UPI000EFD8E17|nr:AbrB/MazE/SpoVT family DNA-binding domain-containing protein [Lactobacillus sp. ESL0260]RMC58725.1 AbrB/MazE/SpoVT family DNA-binding domain-containing protein [Lactobacillus sp. ESL0260]